MKPEHPEHMPAGPAGWKVVIVNCFDTYEARTDLLMKFFQQAGYQTCVCASDFRHVEKVHRQECRPGYRFFHAKPYGRNLSLQRISSHRQLSRDIFTYVENYVEQDQNSSCLLWVLVPPNSVVRDAARIRRRYPGVRLVFDIMDLWPETFPAGRVRGLPFFPAWKRLRDRYLCCADGIVTECRLYRSVLKNALRGVPVRTLYLARPLLPYRVKPDLPENALALCYLGSVNYLIDIQAVADIIQTCRRQMPVVLHIIGSGEKKAELCTKAQKAGAEIMDHGIVYDREKKQRVFASCHYGLNIMKKTVCVGLTMKSIDYLEAGLPLINNISGDTWDAVRRYGIGINYDGRGLDPDLSENQLRRKKARQFFERHFSEEAFRMHLLGLMDQLPAERMEGKRMIRKSNYGIGESIKNGWFLMRTGIQYPSSRLVRFPVIVRGKRYIRWGRKLTTGYHCRFEVNGRHRGKVLVFGENVNVGDFVSIRCAKSIHIGSDVLIGSKVLILDNSHGKYSGDGQDCPDTPPDQRGLRAEPVRIADRVWIGEGSVIQMGVTVGEGSIIAANSVVTKDIPPGVIAGGVPAKVIKRWNQKLQQWL